MKVLIEWCGLGIGLDRKFLSTSLHETITYLLTVTYLLTYLLTYLCYIVIFERLQCVHVAYVWYRHYCVAYFIIYLLIFIVKRWCPYCKKRCIKRCCNCRCNCVVLSWLRSTTIGVSGACRRTNGREWTRDRRPRRWSTSVRLNICVRNPSSREYTRQDVDYTSRSRQDHASAAWTIDAPVRPRIASLRVWSVRLSFRLCLGKTFRLILTLLFSFRLSVCSTFHRELWTEVCV